jgi:hypothetical protein
LRIPRFGQPSGPTSGADSTAARPPRSGSERSRARKREWSPAKDTWLLQEAKAHRPNRKKFGGIGEAQAAIASALNDSRRLPWPTDRRHVASRLSHLMETHRLEGSGLTAFAGAGDESREMESLLDEFWTRRTSLENKRRKGEQF